MAKDQASLKEWKELYEWAREFKELACWDWMDDSSLFGVEDQESGETLYCCVMGALGEVFGLIAYRGSQGLSVYQDIQSGKIDPMDENLHALQTCLSLTFDDRNMLEKKDLTLIKDLGLKFRGRQAWPCFRSHLPGYQPWHLNKDEVRLMGLAIRRAVEIGERLRNEPSCLDGPKEGDVLVACASAGGRETPWTEKWVKPKPFALPRKKTPVDEVRLARIKANSERVDDSWEADFFFAPFIITEGSRPFFPYVALYATHGKGYVLNFCLDSYDGFEKTFQDNFLALLEKV